MPAIQVSINRSRCERSASSQISPTDGELLMQFTRCDDHDALAELLRRHSAMVLGVCRGVLRCEKDAEDACQATFLILLRKASSIRTNDSAAGWLYRVALRTALEAKRQCRQRREETLAEEPPAPEIEFPDIQTRQMTSIMLEELRGLPDKYQTPLIMRYLEGQSRRTIAEQTDTTIVSVQGRLARGKRMLRVRLARRGVSLSVAMGLVAASHTAHAAPATALPTPSGVLSGGSPVVQQLVSEGVQSMLFTAYAKPLAIVATLALATAVVAASDAPKDDAPKSEVAALVLQSEVASEPSEAPAVPVAQAAPAKPTENKPDEHSPTASLPIKDSYDVWSPAGVTGTYQPKQPDAASQQELISFYKQLLSQLIGASFADGGSRESESKIAQVHHALFSAEARLAESRGEHELALKHYEQAAKAADDAFRATQKEHDAGRVALDVLIEAAERRASSKQKLRSLVAATSAPEPALPAVAPARYFWILWQSQGGRQEMSMHKVHGTEGAFVKIRPPDALLTDSQRSKGLELQGFQGKDGTLTKLKSTLSKAMRVAGEEWPKVVSVKWVETRPPTLADPAVVETEPPSSIEPTPTDDSPILAGELLRVQLEREHHEGGKSYRVIESGDLVVNGQGQSQYSGMIDSVTLGGKTLEEATELLKSHLPDIVQVKRIPSLSALSPTASNFTAPAAGATHSQLEPERLEQLQRQLDKQRQEISKLRDQLHQARQSNPDSEDQTSYFTAPNLIPNQPMQPPVKPTTIQPRDRLYLEVVSLPNGYLDRSFPSRDVLVEQQGTIALGAKWGRVKVDGLELDKAEQAIRESIQAVVESQKAMLAKLDGDSQEKQLWEALKEIRVQLRRQDPSWPRPSVPYSSSPQWPTSP